MNAEAKPDRGGAAACADGTGPAVRITYECTECGPLDPDLDALDIDHSGPAHRAVTGHPVSSRARPVRMRRPRATTAGPAVGALPAGDWSDTMPEKLAEPRRVIAFDVYGTPAPKGSMRAALIGGKARLLPGGNDGNRKTIREWEKAIEWEAVKAGSLVSFREDSALYVSIVFYVVRPKVAAKRPRPNTRPDVDKLARLVLDALTGILWSDDGRVADLVLSKRWAERPGQEGARITVTEAVVL